MVYNLHLNLTLPSLRRDVSSILTGDDATDATADADYVNAIEESELAILAASDNVPNNLSMAFSPSASVEGVESRTAHRRRGREGRGTGDRGQGTGDRGDRSRGAGSKGPINSTNSINPQRLIPTIDQRH